MVKTRDLITCQCELCGDVFEATRYDAKYCSSKCKQTAHRTKKRHHAKKFQRKDDWLLEVDYETRDMYFMANTLSSVAGNLICNLANHYGPNAAKIAAHIAHHVRNETMAPVRQRWEIELENLEAMKKWLE